MTLGIRFLILMTAVLAVTALGGVCFADPILYDGFEPEEPGPEWLTYPSCHHMESDTRSSHTGTHSMLAQPNWRINYSDYTVLPAAFSEGVYLSGWIRDDAVISPGLPGPPDNPLWSAEHAPNALIRLEDSSGFEQIALGSIGKAKYADDPQPIENIYCSANTLYDGTKILAGPPYSPVVVRREPGWRKYMIRLNTYTGTAGDVQFYVDGQLVYEGNRSQGPGGLATVDWLVMGGYAWTGEWYWYDDIEMDYWPTPAAAATIQAALAHPDGDIVQVNGLTVQTVYPDFITCSDAASDLIDIYPARFEAPGDVVDVMGRLATSESGRYLDTFVLEKTSESPLTIVSSLAAARELPDGTRVRIPQQTVTASLGPIRFVEEDNRTRGLKIRNIYKPAVGDGIVVDGQMMTVGVEKLLEAERVYVYTHNNTLPDALALPNKPLYPPNDLAQGLLVVTTGEVVRIPDMWYPGWCEIRDGSQSDDDPPVRVQLPTYQICPELGDYIWVKGAAGVLTEETSTRPQIYLRTTDDIRVIQ